MVSLVIPAYNEEKIIRATIAKASDYLQKNCGDYEIIVVDDGSTDKTISALAGTDAAVVALPRNTGKGAAVREGVIRAAGEHIFFTDADLPYSLDFIPEAKELLKGCDIVCGKRFGDYPLRRRVLSAAYNSLARNILNVGIDDIQCGIKGFTRYAAMRLFPICKIDGFAFDTEVLFLAGQTGLCVQTLNVRIKHRADSKIRIAAAGVEMLGGILKIRNSFEAGEYNFSESLQG